MDTSSNLVPTWEGNADLWQGFTRHAFRVNGLSAWVAEPQKALPGNPWVWCMEFPDAFPKQTGAPDFLERGFHYAHISVGNTFGCPTAQVHLDAFYGVVTSKGLSAKPVLLGISRGGLYAYNWAYRNPSKVSVIYGDAPVCDFKSWPGGKGHGKGSPEDWDLLLRHYGFKDESEALDYSLIPIHELEPLAQRNIPLIHVVGDLDEDVPVSENTAILEETYRQLGGQIEVIHKPGIAHHPHGLDDPAPVVEFVFRHIS